MGLFFHLNNCRNIINYPKPCLNHQERYREASLLKSLGKGADALHYQSLRRLRPNPTVSQSHQYLPLHFSQSHMLHLKNRQNAPVEKLLGRELASQGVDASELDEIG